jgi:RNA polymerase sigma-70 factor, ECF subfamily
MDHSKPLSAASVEHLIERARSGDSEAPAARDELFKRCRPMLARWSTERMRGAQPGGARPSDITQEAALRAFSKFETFQGATEGEWLAWLQTILSNRANQSFRDAGRKKRDDSRTLPLDSVEALAEPAVQQTASQAVAFKEDWSLLLGKFQELPEHQQTAIRLRHLEELPFADVALRMGKSDDAVTALLQRATATLREALADRSATDEEVLAKLQALRPAGSRP